MTGEELATRLGAKGGNGTWSAKCPAHDDGTASLVISEGDNGGIHLSRRDLEFESDRHLATFLLGSGEIASDTVPAAPILSTNPAGRKTGSR